MTDDFHALLGDPAIDYDPNVQEVVIRRLVEAQLMHQDRAPAMMQQAARALRLAPARLAAICNLDDPIDRRQALKARPRPGTTVRLPDEKIYPSAGWIGGYLKWAEHMEVPLAWHFWAGLTVLAACCRRNFYTHSGAYPIWPGLYTVLVGPSGEGKSLCMQSAARPMIEAVNRQLKNTRDMEANVDDTINLVPDRITVPSFLDRAAISYTTGAVKEVDDDGKTRRVKAQRWRRRDSATMIIKDELCAFIGKGSIDADAWIELLLDLSNGNDTYVNPTQAKTRTLEGVSMTCLFGSAEENLRKGMPPTFLQGGMMGRCMWIHRLTSGRVYATIPPVDPLTREDLAGWLVQLTRQPAREIIRHPATDDWWEAFYNDWADTKDAHPELRSWHNRMKDQVLRVAMLLALSNGRFVIQVEDMELAKGVLDVERSRFVNLFGILSLSRESELNDTILGAIPFGTPVVESVLLERLKSRIGSLDQFRRGLELLVSAKMVRVEERTRPHANGVSKIVMRAYRRIPKGREG